MGKPRVMARSLGALVLAAIFAVGFSALVTPAAEAGNCLCPPDTIQVNEWGMGSTCAAAKANCSARAHNAADGACQSTTGGDACGFGSIWYNSCYANVKVDCILQVRCEECIQFPGL